MKRTILIFMAITVMAALSGCSGLQSAGGRPAASTAQETLQPAPAAATQTPTASPAHTPTPAPTPSPTPAGVLPQEDYAYFERVGFSHEKDGVNVTAKWASSIRIEVTGAPGAGDSQALCALVESLQGIGGMPEIEFVTEGGNVRIAYVPMKSGRQVDQGYNGKDAAQLFLKWSDDAPVSLSILITDELIGQDLRNAALASLLLRGLGLAQDPQGEYADSALNPAMTAPQPSRLDWLMLALLYNPQVKPGAAPAEAMTAVRALEPKNAGGAKSAGSDSFTKDELLGYFNEVGFYYKGTSQSGSVSKWAAPVRLQISGSPTADQKQMLDEYIAALNNVEGFPGIEAVPSGGNFTVSFAARSALKRSYPAMAESEACGYKLTRGGKGAITKCAIGVDEGFGDAEQARSQLLRILIWSLGVNFTSETWPGSILSLKSNAQDWANLDWQIVALLYRPDVKVGAGRAAVMEMLESSVK